MDRIKSAVAWLAQIGVAVAIALGVHHFVLQVFVVPTGSMEKTIAPGDRILVDKVSQNFRDLRSGDIVVFNGAGSFDRGDQSVDYVKRVVALEGQTVVCCDSYGRVSVDGKQIQEPYLVEGDPTPFGPVRIPDGHMWVLGDNRSHSSDSRTHGPVPVSSIKGRATVVVWPMNEFRVLR